MGAIVVSFWFVNLCSNPITWQSFSLKSRCSYLVNRLVPPVDQTPEPCYPWWWRAWVLSACVRSGRGRGGRAVRAVRPPLQQRVQPAPARAAHPRGAPRRLRRLRPLLQDPAVPPPPHARAARPAAAAAATPRPKTRSLQVTALNGRRGPLRLRAFTIPIILVPITDYWISGPPPPLLLVLSCQCIHYGKLCAEFTLIWHQHKVNNSN